MTQPPFDAFETYTERLRREGIEQHAIWSKPATCPTCGTTEPDGHALWRNHGHTPTRRYEPTWPCIAQLRETP